MKTKDFIKMLEEADPTGEGYIRLPGGGAPWFAENKPGYWDGPYQYLEFGKEREFYPHDSVLVTSAKGYKIDIHVMEASSIIWDEDGDMDRIRKRIRYDYSHYADTNQRSQKEKERWDHIEKEAAKAREFHEKSTKEWTEKTIAQFFGEEKWEVRQPLDRKIGECHAMIAYKSTLLGEKREQLCQGECLAIIESGKFYYETTDKYHLWKYDPEKGKNWSLK
jgi:hypothetical protein